MGSNLFYRILQCHYDVIFACLSENHNDSIVHISFDVLPEKLLSYDSTW